MTTDGAATTAVDHLEAALGVTEALIAGVRPRQMRQPTPCPDYDVGALVEHLVGFATHFADKANGEPSPADPSDLPEGTDLPAAYHDAAERLVTGYRSGAGGDAASPIGVVLMETITHGWDLAEATGQAAPYPDDAVEDALAAGRSMLSPEYRGDGQPFGDEVEASKDAEPLDRLVAFLGRDPSWKV